MPVTIFSFRSLWRAPDSGFSSVRSALNYRAPMPLPSFISNKFRCWSFYIFACYRGTGGRAVCRGRLERGASRPPALPAHAQLRWHHLRRQHVFGCRSHLHGHADSPSREGLPRVGQGRIDSIQKPGRETLHARFAVTDEELADIRGALETQRSVDLIYLIELKDSSGTVCATVEKLIYIRKR